VLPNADPRQAPWVDLELISRCGAPRDRAEPASRSNGSFRRPKPANATDQTVLEARDWLGRESAIQAALIAPTRAAACD